MNVREAVMLCCKESEMSLRELAAMAGMDPGNLSRALSEWRNYGNQIRVDKLIQLVEKAGGMLIVRTPGDGDEYELDGEEDYLLDEDDNDKLCFPNS